MSFSYTYCHIFSFLLFIIISSSHHHSIIDAFFIPPITATTIIKSTTTTTSRLYAQQPHRSARDQERRDEERRRKTRVKDVVIGQTSAVPGAQDYQLHTQQTEQEWLRYMTPDEKMVYQYTEQGMEHLKLLRVAEAVEAFEQVFLIKPDAYVWHAGMALYYSHEYQRAADRLAQCARIYETKLGQPATEERIWWYACQLQSSRHHHNHNHSSNNKSIDPEAAVANWTPLPYHEDTTDQLLASETRKVVKLAHQLFRASFENNNPLAVVLARAQLRTIAGPPQQQSSVIIKRPDPKLWKLHAWYYLGLHYDAVGDVSQAKQCMKRALLLASGGNGSDIIHVLPMLHMSQRNWFDDEEHEEENGMEEPIRKDHDKNDTALFQQIHLSSSSSLQETATTSSTPLPSPIISNDYSNVDPYFVQSLQSGIEEMRYYELKDALRAKGLPGTGPKAELVQKLLQSVLVEAGLMRGG